MHTQRTGQAHEESASTQALREALEPFLAQAEALVVAFESIPDPHVPLAEDQFAAMIADSTLYEQMKGIFVISAALQDLDLSRPDAIGRRLRPAVADHVERLRAVLDEATELGWFTPPTSLLSALRSSIIETGLHVARIAASVISVLCSRTPEEAIARQGEWNALLADHSSNDEVLRLIEAAGEIKPSDLDSRASLAFGRRLVVTDADGLLDPALFLAGFAADDDALAALGEASASFLRHLDLTDLDDVAGNVALALPAISIAILDRPLAAHRLARQSIRILRNAQGSDPHAAAALMSRIEGEAPRIFAAAKRMHDDAAYIARGHASDTEDVVNRLVARYKSLAESTFRTYAWMIDQALRIARGRGASPQMPIPMLHELAERLASHGDPAATVLADCISSDLRNGEAHEDFRYDARAEEVVVRGDIRIPLSSVLASVEQLEVTTVGLDAAYALVTASATDHLAPSWLADGTAPHGVHLLLRGMFGAYGMHLAGIDDADEAIVRFTYDDPDDAPVTKMLVALATAALCYPDSTRLVISHDAPRGTSFSVETASYRAFTEAKEEVRDLAVLLPLLGAVTSARSDVPAEDVLVLWIRVIAIADVSALIEALERGITAPLARLRIRTRFVQDAAAEHLGRIPPKGQAAIKNLSVAATVSHLVERGDLHARQTMLKALAAAGSWAAARETGVFPAEDELSP